MNERLSDYLDQMIETAENICAYVDGMNKHDFLADKRTQQAVILNLMIIGEAAARMSQDHNALASRYPDVPWRNMRGMRNRIAHGYFGINLDVVWDTVCKAVPPLLEQVSKIRKSEN